MNIILSKLLSVMGWKKIMTMVWSAAYKELKKRVEDTQDVEWDDDALEFANQLVKAITA